MEHEHPPLIALVPGSADSAAVVDLGTPDGRGSLARGGGLVTPALMLVNLGGYLLAVIASHSFSGDRYGELTALLSVLLVASVPALALQAVVARSVALRPEGEPPGVRERVLLVRSALAGLVATAVAAAAAPAVAAFLHVPIGGPLWVAAGLLPLGLLTCEMGLLQGTERFPALAAVICAQAVGKGIGLVPLLLGGGPAAVLAGLAVGAGVAGGLGLLLTGTGQAGPRPAVLPSGRETTLAATGLLALLALANLDVLLARHNLSRDGSGTYAVGSVLARGAFWLPQAVAVVAFPRLADPEEGGTVLRRALLVVVALGVTSSLGVLVVGHVLLSVTFGSQYGSLAPLAPVFVLQGAALAVVQLLVYRGIAIGHSLTTRVVLVGIIAEVAVVLGLGLDRPGLVVAAACTTAVAVAAVGAVLDRG